MLLHVQRKKLSYNSLPHNSEPLTTLDKEPFENIVEKGENGDNSIFSFFHNVFNPIKYKNHDFISILILSFANAFNLDQSKIW